MLVPVEHLPDVLPEPLNRIPLSFWQAVADKEYDARCRNRAVSFYARKFRKATLVDLDQLCAVFQANPPQLAAAPVHGITPAEHPLTAAFKRGTRAK